MLIPGIIYIPDWIDDLTENNLLTKIQTGIWEDSLKRQVQQFGSKYNYTNRKITPSDQAIPAWIYTLYPKLMKFFIEAPDQIIINKYEKGENISKHVDANVFGPTVASLSLLSDTEMTFGQHSGDEIKYPLRRKSLIIMTGEARTQWYHYIAPVKEKRVSITFRTILK